MDQLVFAEFKSFFNKEDCPICQITAEYLERFYFWFVIEHYYSPNMMQKIKNAFGFCKEHTWQLIEAGKPYITGVMYEYLTAAVKSHLEQFLKEMKRMEPKKRGLFRRRDDRKEFQRAIRIFTHQSSCPVCESLAESTRNAMTQFLEVLKEEEMKALYLKSDGLCLHHLLQILPISDKKEAIFLIESQLERNEQLREDLCAFLESFDYRYRNEAKGREQTSWVRAAQFFVGRRYDPLSLLKRLEDRPSHFEIV